MGFFPVASVSVQGNIHCTHHSNINLLTGKITVKIKGISPCTNMIVILIVGKGLAHGPKRSTKFLFYFQFVSDRHQTLQYIASKCQFCQHVLEFKIPFYEIWEKWTSLAHVLKRLCPVGPVIVRI